MDAYLVVCAGAFGLIIGSFLNVLIFRFNSGKTLGGRSECLVCSHELTAFELVPVASFLVLRGRCRKCKTRISPQYVLVELIAGAIFAFLTFRILATFGPSLFSFSLFLAEAAFWSILIAITFYDLRHKIIPDLFSALAVVFAFATVLLRFGTDAGQVMMQSFAAFLLSFFLFVLWFVTRGRGMGFGDVKLAFSLGLYLGLAQGVSGLVFAFWIGAGVALLTIFIQYLSRLLGTKRLSPSATPLTMKSKVPFAPFLVAGTLLASILQSDLFHLSLFLNG